VIAILLLVTLLYLVTSMPGQNNGSPMNPPRRRVPSETLGGDQAAAVQPPEAGMENEPPEEAVPETLVPIGDTRTGTDRDGSVSKDTELVQAPVVVPRSVTLPAEGSAAQLPEGEPPEEAEQDARLQGADPETDAAKCDRVELTKALVVVPTSVTRPGDDESVTRPPEDDASKPLAKFTSFCSGVWVQIQGLCLMGKERYDALSPKARRRVLFGASGSLVALLLLVAIAGGRRESPSPSVPDSTVAAPSEEWVPPEPATSPQLANPSDPASVPGNYVSATVNASDGIYLRQEPGGEKIGGLADGATVCVDPTSVVLTAEGVPFVKTPGGNWIGQEYLEVSDGGCF
jgi:hypothetical protein